MTPAAQRGPRVALGARLRELRKARRATLADVARETGISVSFLSDIEKGRTLPSLETAQSLADFYRMSLSGLLSGIRIGVAK